MFFYILFQQQQQIAGVNEYESIEWNFHTEKNINDNPFVLKQIWPFSNFKNFQMIKENFDGQTRKKNWPVNCLLKLQLDY